MTTLSPLPQEEQPPQGRIVRVTYRGFGGTYWQPPEDGEGIAWCPVCDAEVDVPIPLYPEWPQEIECDGHTFIVYIDEEGGY